MALPQPDQRLLDKARAGDERAFASLVEEYRRPVLAYVYRMVGDYGLAEDLVQDVFLRVFQRLGTFRGHCLFTTWLFQIAKNRVLDELRAQARRPEPPRELTELPTNEDVLSRNGEIDETVAAIWQAVGKLDLDLKMPLLLRDVAGLSYREIGETLEIPLPTVKWRLYTARETVIHAVTKHQPSPRLAGSEETPAVAAERVQPRLAPQPT
jgi:RNA polymerase sigma-70 factor, ECF subfamily